MLRKLQMLRKPPAWELYDEEFVYLGMARYEKLRVWQNGQDLALRIYRLTDSFPRREIWALTNQVRRAAVSIPANIAEGAGRGSDKEFRQYLLIDRGSLAELQTYLRLSRHLGYAEAASLDELLHRYHEVENGINSLIASLGRR